MKIKKICDIHPTLLFTEYDFLKKYRESFAVSELWRIHMQLSCGVLIDPSNPVRDGKIVSAIRNRLAPALDTARQQSVLYGKGEALLKDKDLCISYATCAIL